jgi:hypothetical protein
MMTKFQYSRRDMESFNNRLAVIFIPRLIIGNWESLLTYLRSFQMHWEQDQSICQQWHVQEWSGLVVTGVLIGLRS